MSEFPLADWQNDALLADENVKLVLLAGPKMYFDGNWSDAPQQLANCAAFMRLTNWTPVCCDHLVISSCIPL